MSASQVVHVPFSAGLDERVDPKQAPAGTLTTMRNAYFSRTGEVAKRPGLDSLGPIDTDGGYPTATRVFERDGSLCFIGSDGYVYSYVEALQRWKKGPASLPLSARTEIVAASVGSANQPQIAYYGGYVVYVWHVGSPYSPGEIYVKVVEVSTGTHVVPPTRVTTTGLGPRVVAVGGIAYVAWVEGPAVPRSLYACKVTLSGAFPVSVSIPMVVAGLSASDPQSAAYDISAMGGNQAVLCWAWADVAGGLTLAVSDSTLTFVLGPSAYGGPVGLCDSVSISSRPWAASKLTHLVYHEAGWRCGTWDWNATAIVPGSDAAVAGAAGYATGNSCLQIGDDEFIVALNGHVRTYKPSVGAFVNDITVYSGDLLCRPFLFGGKYYSMCCPQRGQDDTVLASAVMMELGYPNTSGATKPVSPAGNLAMRQYSRRVGNVPNAAVVSSTEVRLVYGTTPDKYSPLYPFQESVESATIKAGDTLRGVEVLGSALFAGAAPWWFDGTDAADVGFYGENPRAFSSATPGGLTALGSYVVGIIYERMDANGVLHRSPVYQSSVTLTGANTAVDVYGYNAVIDAKQRPSLGSAYSSYLSIYLSDNLGTVLYRYSRPPTYKTIKNASTTIGATASQVLDGVFLTVPRQPAYTTGDVLDDNAPPSFIDICLHRGRVFAIGGDQRTVWFSKLIADEPSVFPGFNEALTVRVDDGSNVVALASLDTVLLIFTEQGIYYLEGEGPGPTGFPTDYGQPRKIAADVGCMSALSVVGCQLGVLFQGTDGRIWMMTRSMSLDPLGAGVEETIASYPVVRAATLVEGLDQVRFACTNAAGDAGITLVLDYAPGIRQWSTFEHGVVVSACTWRGRYVCVLSSGAVRIENPASWLDNTAWYSMVIETAWFGGPTTWQRVRAVQTVGDYKSAHGFTVELSVDHSSSYLQTATFTEAEVLVNRGRATVRLGAQNGMNPRCKAMRIRITDMAPAVLGTGESTRWSGFALEILPAPGLSRHVAANAKR